MNLLIKITLAFAIAVMTFQPMAAKTNEPSYNFSRALEEAQRGNKQSAMEYFNKEVADNPKNGYAYMAMAAFHMDNSDYGEAYQSIQPTSNENELIKFVLNSKDTSGGEGPEFYELVLRKIVEETLWRENSTRSILLIADAVPHELGYTY